MALNKTMQRISIRMLTFNAYCRVRKSNGSALEGFKLLDYLRPKPRMVGRGRSDTCCIIPRVDSVRDSVGHVVSEDVRQGSVRVKLRRSFH